MTLEHRISVLEAVEEIKGLKAAYAKVCDTGYKSAGFFPMFTKDAIWVDETGRFGRHDGRDAIGAFFDGVSGSIGWALHYMIAPKITVHDDLVNAEGTWYLWQPCTIDGNPVWLTGTYFDRYRKDEGVWKFSEVHLSVQTISPFEEGWVKRPFLGE
jgi:hypothetical protein